MALEIRIYQQGLFLILFFGFVRNVTSTQQSTAVEPTFAEPIPNITVTAGRNVSLPCVVDNLQNYRVAWIHKNRYTLLTLQNRVITRSSRYKVSHNSHRTWWLHITNVQERDRGEYMCQINTVKMMKQVGYLEVVVPPYLDEELTSSDTDVREGTDVSLRCVAKGSPEPDVTWRREDGQEISIGKSKVTNVRGSYLNITKVSRLHMGAYLCIASNGVAPSLSKRILLGVSFTPMIWIPNQLVGAPIATDILLQCNLESHPRSVTYWIREGGIMVLTNVKYKIEVQPTVLYKVQLKLYIHNLEPEDYGSYTCVAKNSLGETEGTIRLYEIPPPSSIVNAQGEDIFHSKSEKLRNGHQQNSYKKHEEKDYSSQDPSDHHSSFQPKEEFSQILKTKDVENNLARRNTHSRLHCLSSMLFLVMLYLHQNFVLNIS
ncbi:neurotrimin-like isoform X1 [Argiope bruennichi]|uniref:neurotrimin-like isoform X1 n=1 Tax=Argiope bruennichi TaxID=94029 RepID=UPI002493D4BA|nr:neurotrimin-like isoform X1 [Argiope bruennichi]